MKWYEGLTRTLYTFNGPARRIPMEFTRKQWREGKRLEQKARVKAIKARTAALRQADAARS